MRSLHDNSAKKKKSLHDKKNIRVCEPILRSKEDCGPWAQSQKHSDSIVHVTPTHLIK